MTASEEKDAKTTVIDPTRSSLTREEMACIKTALACIVVKRRLALRRQKEESNGEGDEGSSPTAATTWPLLNLPTQRSVAAATSSAVRPEPSVWRQRLPVKQDWSHHVQHLLLLMGQAAEKRQDERCEGLATHVACQLEQAAVSDKQQVAGWLQKQLTASKKTFLWHALLEAKPVAVAALLVPVLLDILSSYVMADATSDDACSAPSNGTQQTGRRSQVAAATTFSAVHLLHLLETALQQADRNVLSNALEVLLAAAPTPVMTCLDLCSFAGTGEQLLTGQGLTMLAQKLSSVLSAQDNGGGL